MPADGFRLRGLAGHGASKPVGLGNLASERIQLDIAGAFVRPFSHLTLIVAASDIRAAGAAAKRVVQ
jgi:hypothetical protein